MNTVNGVPAAGANAGAPANAGAVNAAANNAANAAANANDGAADQNLVNVDDVRTPEANKKLDGNGKGIRVWWSWLPLAGVVGAVIDKFVGKKEKEKDQEEEEKEKDRRKN